VIIVLNIRCSPSLIAMFKVDGVNAAANCKAGGAVGGNGFSHWCSTR